MNVRRLAVLVMVALALATGCASNFGADPESKQSSSPAPTQAAVNGDDPYVRLAEALQQRGVEVWFETDLVARWQEGPAAFAAAVHRAAGLARLPGVRGLKIADEIGYEDGLDTPAEALRFLADTDRAVHAAAPSAKLLVDAVVPDLGCLPWRGDAQQACAATTRARHPAATEAALTSYLRTGVIDTLDLSTGLLGDATYRGWGTDVKGAQEEIWGHVAGSDWPALTRLQSRKALAEPGGYGGSTAAAAADVTTYVDAPVAAGAAAVDIWTWRQQYDGKTVGLLGPDLRPNALWVALRKRHDDGVRLITHMTPSTMPDQQGAFDEECDTAAQVFDEIFVAAGTG